MKGAAVIQAFGGLTQAARAIGAPITTVQHWRDQDRIPPWREREVAEAAERAGIALPDDGSADAA